MRIAENTKQHDKLENKPLLGGLKQVFQLTVSSAVLAAEVEQGI